MKRIPVVAIVGRPNVGKSTLFNRITSARRALVHKLPGVTRDAQRATTEWNGVVFELVDTGGLFSGINDPLVAQVEERALRAAAGADAVLLVVDGETGLVPADFDVAKQARSLNLPTLLVVNKTEREKHRLGAAEFSRLGFETFYEVSAMHGEGIGELLDDAVKLLPRASAEDTHSDLRLAIVGVPNVGKSSLVNAILGSDIAIVDSRPGTTRDSIDASVTWRKRKVTLVDTAGIRRKARTSEDLDVLSTMKSLESIERCDVALVMLDATRELTNQDIKVASYPHRAGKGVVVVFNKWDAVEKKTDKTYVERERDFRRRCGFLNYAPIIFISAKTHQRINTVLETAWRVREETHRRVPTSDLNRFLTKSTQRTPPPFHAGGNGKIFYGTQVDVAPPTFHLFVNRVAHFGRYYLRQLTNQLRNEYGFEGTDIRIELAQRRDAKAAMRKEDKPRATRRARLKKSGRRKRAAS
ncbi:MAG TPA: ribosome biogenesis GTPase Der [Candidatus Krumholzibacteria bacterium]|nr:ribosome biogenesis GTPase Der [Candidatus Krumholzibacteria bacterium]